MINEKPENENCVTSGVFEKRGVLADENQVPIGKVASDAEPTSCGTDFASALAEKARQPKQ